MIDLIKIYASNFREVLEHLDKEDVGNFSHFENFPTGCCGDTCDLLRWFLKSKGINTIYVTASDGCLGTHAWLEFEDYIIDITADQFPDVDEKVIISNNSIWHNKFENPSKEPEDYELASNDLELLYYKVLSKL